MNTNILVDGYIPKFDNFKFTGKTKNGVDYTTLKVNIYEALGEEIGTDGKKRQKQTIIELTGYNKVANKLAEYQPGEHIICNADFNGINTFTTKTGEFRANVRAVVRSILLYSTNRNTDSDYSYNSSSSPSQPSYNDSPTYTPSFNNDINPEPPTFPDINPNSNPMPQQSRRH